MNSLIIPSEVGPKLSRLPPEVPSETGLSEQELDFKKFVPEELNAKETSNKTQV